MRITITSVAGVSDGAGHHYQHKHTVDVDERQARAWIAAGHAQPADGETDTQARTSRRRGRRTADRPPAEDRTDSE